MNEQTHIHGTCPKGHPYKRDRKGKRYCQRCKDASFLAAPQQPEHTSEVGYGSRPYCPTHPEPESDSPPRLGPPMPFSPPLPAPWRR